MALCVFAAVITTGCNTTVTHFYDVGDTVDVEYSLTMKLVSAEFSGNQLTATFTVTNRGTEISGYNLWLSLQARDPEGSPLSQLIPCGTNLDGQLGPGEQATGSICWLRKTLDTVTIHYIRVVFNTDIAWKVHDPATPSVS